MPRHGGILGNDYINLPTLVGTINVGVASGSRTTAPPRLPIPHACSRTYEREREDSGFGGGGREEGGRPVACAPVTRTRSFNLPCAFAIRAFRARRLLNYLHAAVGNYFRPLQLRASEMTLGLARNDRC